MGSLMCLMPYLKASSRIVRGGAALGIGATFLLLASASAVWAHHSPSAIFDMSKRFTLAGTLTKVEWTNPHIVVFMDAKGKDGGMETWKFESNPPSWFRRVGVNRSDFAGSVGHTVTVEGVRAKDGSLYGYLQKITLADGNSMELVNGSGAEAKQ